MPNNKYIPILAGIFLLVFVLGIVFFILRNIGGTYSDRLSSIIPKSQDAPFTREKRTIRKITVKKDEEDGCIEITPDGIVRTYESCGGELTEANRLSDPKNILKLINLAEILDFSVLREKPKGSSLMLIIETDHGTEIIYVPTGNGGDSGSVGDIIDQIDEDLPQPTPTYGPTTIPTPTLPGTTMIPTETPTPTLLPGYYPTPTPEPTNGLKPFVCGYTPDESGKRPYNVSNYICSTEPSPAP